MDYCSILKNLTRKISVLIIFISLPVISYADEIVNTLEKKFDTALFSLSISKVSGENLVSYNAQKLLIPASSLKVVTTVYAIEKLGLDFRFKTEIKYSGKITDGVLDGDLYIVGGGDMTLGSENFGSSIDKVFNNIYTVLKKNNINKINGNLYVDTSLANDFQEASWEWQDIGNYYAARVTGLSINDNSYKIYFKTGNRAGEKTEVVKTEPDVGYKITNHVITGNDGSGDNSYIYSNPYMDEIIIRGSIGRTDNFFITKGSINDPPSFFAKSFFDYLKKAGTGIKGWYVIDKNDSSKNLNFMDEIKSPPLYEIIRITNRKSFNFYAESLLRYALIKKNITGLGASISELNGFLKRIGINEKRIVDGSGLSRGNFFSADGFVKVLNYAHKQPYFNYFYDSLGSWKNSDVKGHIKKFGSKKGLDIKIKSGSLNRVRSYVGYINSKNSGLLSFCFIINNYTVLPQDIDEIFEEILATVSEKY